MADKLSRRAFLGRAAAAPVAVLALKGDDPAKAKSLKVKKSDVVIDAHVQMLGQMGMLGAVRITERIPIKMVRKDGDGAISFTNVDPIIWTSKAMRPMPVVGFHVYLKDGGRFTGKFSNMLVAETKNEYQVSAGDLQLSMGLS